jgi:hypothetical protein
MAAARRAPHARLTTRPWTAHPLQADSTIRRRRGASWSNPSPRACPIHHHSRRRRRKKSHTSVQTLSKGTIRTCRTGHRDGAAGRIRPSSTGRGRDPQRGSSRHSIRLCRHLLRRRIPNTRLPRRVLRLPIPSKDLRRPPTGRRHPKNPIQRSRFRAQWVGRLSPLVTNSEARTLLLLTLPPLLRPMTDEKRPRAGPSGGALGGLEAVRFFSRVSILLAHFFQTTRRKSRTLQ